MPDARLQRSRYFLLVNRSAFLFVNRSGATMGVLGIQPATTVG
jgi:hypothetical protein